MDYGQDPLYQWYCQQLRQLRDQYDRTNRREAKVRSQLMDQIKQIQAQKARLREIPPSFTNYGVF